MRFGRPELAGVISRRHISRLRINVEFYVAPRRRRLVLWGGRAGDRQFGTRQDLREAQIERLEGVGQLAALQAWANEIRAQQICAAEVAGFNRTFNVVVEGGTMEPNS